MIMNASHFFLLVVYSLVSVVWSSPYYRPNSYPFTTTEDEFENKEMNSQELLLPEDYEEAAVTVNRHPEIEVMAQSICTAITGFSGWTYAVQRVCRSSSTVTCNNLCKSSNLRSQDRQTRRREWRAAAAIHVYRSRPSSSPGTASAPHIGLKVYRYGTIHGTGCGPNFCCCHVPV